jgi:hypothetical protein
MDIINAINLGRPIPVADGFTGDVITLDAASIRASRTADAWAAALHRTAIR